MASKNGFLAALLVGALAMGGCVSDGPPTAPGDDLAAQIPSVIGIAAVAHGPDGTPAHRLDLPATHALARSLERPSYEPTIGADAKGALFMTAVDGQAPTVVRSRDGGATWTDVGPRLADVRNPPRTFDPFVYVDPTTGRVFDIDLEYCSYLSYSDDQGSTWTTNPLVCASPTSDDHQSLAAGPPRRAPTIGYENILYYCVNRLYDAACATSWNGGLTFNPAVPVFPPVEVEPPPFAGGLTAHVQVGPDGKAFLPQGTPNSVQVAVSENDGLTWTVRTIDRTHPPDSHEVAVAVDEANNVYAFWISQHRPYLSFSHDGGATWSRPHDVAPPGVAFADFPTIAAGAPGRAAFAYVATTTTDPWPGDAGLFDLLGADPAAFENWTWNAYLGVAVDLLAGTPTFLTATVNDPADPIARGECARTRCYGEDGSGALGDFIKIVIDPAGRPWAALVDACTRKCATDGKTPSDVGIGMVGTLNAGPRLRGPLGGLPPLDAPRSVK